jgi:hypothetical protein
MATNEWFCANKSKFKQKLEIGGDAMSATE